MVGLMSVAPLLSWGRYPRYAQTPLSIYWRSDLSRALAHLVHTHGSTLPFGLGRSYGDSCLAVSDHVLHLRPMDRIIAVDWRSGVIRVESGITLEELLVLAIPRGWFLPVTPGTKYVTLGGAIANDVHGKNHHARGTFGGHVLCFGLVRSDRPAMTCSPKENAELFAATIGGLGLTGVIDWVELQLLPIQSSRMDITTIRFNSLHEFFVLSDELDSSHEYTVAWVDCLARNASTGRGVYIAGNHSRDGVLEVDTGRKLSLSFMPPISMVNRLSLSLFNTIYYQLRKPGQHQSVVGYDPFFYPLDRILEWNRIYGPKGFQQYQCVIPRPNAEPATRDLLNAIATTGSGSFLAVMKRCGDIRSPGLLSFPIPGLSLALDFPQHDRLNNSLFPRLDDIVRHADGRLYPAKDAHMSGEDFRDFYPQWEQLERLRDPALCSHFWKRVTLQ
ncbi:MAG: FAD-binding oxidoreductase [Desulfatitalea sp.]